MNILEEAEGSIKINGLELESYNKIISYKVNSNNINNIKKKFVCKNCSIILFGLNIIENYLNYNIDSGYFLCINCSNQNHNIKKIKILDIVSFNCFNCNKTIQKNFCMDKNGKYYCDKCQKIERKLCQCVKNINYIFNFEKVFTIINKLSNSLILLDDDNIVYFYYSINGKNNLLKTRMDIDYFNNYFITTITVSFINKELKKNVFLNKDEILEYLYEKLKINNDFTIT